MSAWDNAMLNRPRRRWPVYVAAAAIGAAIGIGVGATTHEPYQGAATITCRPAHIDDLAPEAIEAIGRLRWDYPAERIVIDQDTGIVRAWPVALVPSPCNTGIEEDEVLIIG